MTSVPTEPSAPMTSPSSVPARDFAQSSPCVMRLVMFASVRCSGPVFSQVSISVMPPCTDATSLGPSPMLERITVPRMTTTAAPMMSSASTIARTLGRNRWKRFMSGCDHAVMSIAKNRANTTGKMMFMT